MFTGHHHSYQRTCPVYNETCVDNGITYIVTGAAGADFSTNIYIFQPAYMSFVNDEVHGYTRAKVKDGIMQLDFVSDIDRSIVDTVQIKPKAGYKQQHHHHHHRQPRNNNDIQIQ